MWTGFNTRERRKRFVKEKEEASMSRTIGPTLALLSATMLGGCSTIDIIVPEPLSTLTTERPLTIAIDNDANASTFVAKLDGTDITQSFGPVAAGQTVTAKAPPLLPPHPDDPVHRLKAEASWQGGPRLFGATSVTHQFYAMQLSIRPVDDSNFVCDPVSVCRLELAPGEARQMRVELPETPYGNLDVYIEPQNNKVAVEGQLPGAEAHVVMPGTQRYALFDIRGHQPGECMLVARASASEQGWLKIVVTD